jgi:carbonic anhydrase
MEKITPAVTQARTYAKPDDLIESAIRENVRRSTQDVLAHSQIVRDAVNSGKLSVIEAEYQLDSGRVVVLTCLRSDLSAQLAKSHFSLT